MRTCDCCDQAEEAPRLDLFRVDCMSCTGRAFAMACTTEEEFREKTPAYRAALERLFPGDAKEAHRWVTHWRSREAIIAARIPAG